MIPLDNESGGGHATREMRQETINAGPHKGIAGTNLRVSKLKNLVTGTELWSGAKSLQNAVNFHTRINTRMLLPATYNPLQFT